MGQSDLMGGAAQVIALAVGILAILGTLTRISWQMGRLVQRFGDHVISASEIHQDQEKRLRNLERPRGRRGS